MSLFECLNLIFSFWMKLGYPWKCVMNCDSLPTALGYPVTGKYITNIYPVIGKYITNIYPVTGKYITNINPVTGMHITNI